MPTDVIEQGPLTDRSGTIQTGGSAQWSTAARNVERLYLLIQNPTTALESIWVDFDAVAVSGSPAVELVPGACLTFESTFIPTSRISVIAATTGTKYTIKEG